MEKRRTAAVILALGLSGFPIKAARANVVVKVPVVCEAEEKTDVYTVRTEALGETPRETIRKGTLRLRGMEEGEILMEFDEPGNYHYRIMQDAELPGDKSPDSTIYKVDVCVLERDDGQLAADPVVYKMAGHGKETSVTFWNTPEKYYEKESETAKPAVLPGQEEGKGPVQGQAGAVMPVSAAEVRTGDQTPLLLFGILLLLSAAALVITSGGTARRSRRGGDKR